MGRILGIDYGERRIGVAVSDPSRTIAQALPTIIRRRGRRPPYSKIQGIIDEWEVQRVVVGLPVELSGDEGRLAEEVRNFGEGLGQRSGIPVDYWDERYTSSRAERELRRLDLPAGARREKERVDAMAATLILQAYLDAKSDS
jgi:putative Holliday junction resolvase